MVSVAREERGDAGPHLCQRIAQDRSADACVGRGVRDETGSLNDSRRIIVTHRPPWSMLAASKGVGSTSTGFSAVRGIGKRPPIRRAGGLARDIRLATRRAYVSLDGLIAACGRHGRYHPTRPNMKAPYPTLKTALTSGGFWVGFPRNTTAIESCVDAITVAGHRANLMCHRHSASLIARNLHL